MCMPLKLAWASFFFLFVFVCRTCLSQLLKISVIFQRVFRVAFPRPLWYPAPFLRFCLRQATRGSDFCREIIVVKEQETCLIEGLSQCGLVLNGCRGTLRSAMHWRGVCEPPWVSLKILRLFVYPGVLELVWSQIMNAAFSLNTQRFYSWPVCASAVTFQYCLVSFQIESVSLSLSGDLRYPWDICAFQTPSGPLAAGALDSQPSPSALWGGQSNPLLRSPLGLAHSRPSINSSWIVWNRL